MNIAFGKGNYCKLKPFMYREGENNKNFKNKEKIFHAAMQCNEEWCKINFTTFLEL